MNESFPTSTSNAVLRRWRCAAIICALTAGCSVALLAVTAFLAVQDLNTHYNFYYLLWKAGIPAMKPGTARAFALRRRAHSRAPGPESLSLGSLGVRSRLLLTETV
jgi:hypothetical protein